MCVATEEFFFCYAFLLLLNWSWSYTFGLGLGPWSYSLGLGRRPNILVLFPSVVFGDNLPVWTGSKIG